MSRFAERFGVRWTVMFGGAMICAGLILSTGGEIWQLYVGHGVLIGHAAFRPSLSGRQTVAQIADIAVVQRADHAARARASRIETDDELCFRGHIIPPPYCDRPL